MNVRRPGLSSCLLLIAIGVTALAVGQSQRSTATGTITLTIKPPPSPPCTLLFARDGELKWSGSENCVGGDVWSNRDITLTGARNTVTGRMHAGGSLKVSGANNSVAGITEHAGVATVNNTRGTNANALNLREVSPVILPYPLSRTPHDFRIDYNLADLRLSLNHQPLSTGTYFVSGEIDISASNCDFHDVTLIANGPIKVSGHSNQFTPNQFETMFYSVYSTIHISGSNMMVAGDTYAPDGLIWLTGSSNVVTGRVLGVGIFLSGSRWMIEQLVAAR